MTAIVTLPIGAARCPCNHHCCRPCPQARYSVQGRSCIMRSKGLRQKVIEKLTKRGPDLQGTMHNVCDLKRCAAYTCDAGQHILGGLQAQGLGGQARAETRLQVEKSQSCGNGNGQQKSSRCAWYIIEARVVGLWWERLVSTQEEGRTSLIGKAVVALNDKFGYSRRLDNQAFKASNFQRRASASAKHGLFVCVCA